MTAPRFMAALVFFLLLFAGGLVVVIQVRYEGLTEEPWYAIGIAMTGVSALGAFIASLARAFKVGDEQARPAQAVEPQPQDASEKAEVMGG